MTWVHYDFGSFAALALSIALSGVMNADEPFSVKRCELVPLPSQQVSFQIDGLEKTRWHFGSVYPRPFFYPFDGPSGSSLTRIGHPGANNHDHHLSVWFAHHDVNGVSFWSDRKEGRIRQTYWYDYHDSDTEALMAAKCDWLDGAGEILMEQDIVAALIPMSAGEHALELQISLRPPAKVESVELGKTNFGFLAVRMAKSVSVHFGGGKLTSSEGDKSEQTIFGKQARWMDYSGPVSAGIGTNRKTTTEGITYFDHPQNPRYPTHWHVREDGWMGASFCMHDGYTIHRESPLTLRYLLHAHAGPYDHDDAAAVHVRFAGRAGFEIIKSAKKHQQYEVQRSSVPNNTR